MNERKIIGKYIGAMTAGLRIAGAALLLAAIVCGGLALRAKNALVPEPVRFDALEGEKNRYSYLDVIGVSDWVYTYDDTYTYYILEDPEHYLYVGRLSPEDFERLTPQNDYWNGLSGEEIPVRLTGLTLSLTDTMKENFMDVLGLDSDTFDEYFGFRSFYAGATPQSENASMWTGAALLLLVLGAIPLAGGRLPATVSAKKALDRLESTGQMERAAAELTSPAAITAGKDRFRLTPRFLFGRSSGLAAAWGDVLWCYERVIKWYTVVSGRALMVGTADGRLHSVLLGPGEEEEILRVMDTIRERNPNVLTGFSKENREAWKARCR